MVYSGTECVDDVYWNARKWTAVSEMPLVSHSNVDSCHVTHVGGVKGQQGHIGSSYK